MNNKFTVGQAFVYKGRNTFFIIENVRYIDKKKDYLYTVKYVGLRPDGKLYSSYYEDRILAECIPVKNQNMSRLLYS